MPRSSDLPEVTGEGQDADLNTTMINLIITFPGHVATDLTGMMSIPLDDALAGLGCQAPGQGRREPSLHIPTHPQKAVWMV